MSVLWWTLVVSSGTLCVVEAYSSFRDSIPNGHSVPHPCDKSQTWNGVGHQNYLGGGSRNPFGLAFKANGYKWDEALCRLDSDGDGRTNGQELGDPNCAWKKGNTAFTENLSHPGVCEPVTALQCQAKNNWNVCENRDFYCPGIKEAGVVKVNYDLPKTNVPAETTIHYCVMVELPHDKDYHVIADLPDNDNINVMHHSMLYACEESAEADQLAIKFSKPAPCGMPDLYSACKTILGGWSVGMTGNCRGKKYGNRIGKTAAKKALLELHWTNPEKRSDYTDASGLSIYYTPNLREFDAGVLKLGQVDLQIPPKQPRVVVQAECSSYCTKRNSGSIFLTGGGFHMHLLGRGGILEHWKGGERHVLVQDENWEYDKPAEYVWDPPVEIKPGDRLVMKCVFDSTDRTEETYYGKSTYDEMCFANLDYYPKQREEYCEQMSKIDICDVRMNNNCDLDKFFSDPTQIDAMLDKLYEACSDWTCNTVTCQKASSEAHQHECLKGDMAKLVYRLLKTEGYNDEAQLIKMCDSSIQ